MGREEGGVGGEWQTFRAERDLYVAGRDIVINFSRGRATGPPHHSKWLAAYLAAAMRAAQEHPYLGVLAQHRQPPLTTVYVRQQARHAGSLGAGSSAPSGDPGEQAADAIGQDRRLSLEELLNLERSCVVIGGSGAGKSSLLRAALVEMANPWIEGMAAPSRPGTVIPVRVTAADIAAKDALHVGIALGAEAELRRAGSTREWTADLFAVEPMPGIAWLVLVDALDEITSEEGRREVVRKLTGALADAPGRYRFILASRPLPERELPVEEGWAPRPYELQPFEDDQLPEFAGKWFTALGLQDPARLAADFVSALQRDKLTELAQNPLLATVLCQLFANDPSAPLPYGRTEIYDQWVGQLVKSTDRRLPGDLQAQLARALPGHPAAARYLGDSWFALACRLAAARIGGETATAPDLVAAWAGTERPARMTGADWSAVLVEALRRGGLVQERAGDLVFIHRTIAEYLAALHTARDPRLAAAALQRILAMWTGTDADDTVPTWLDSAEDMSFERFVIAEWLAPPRYRRPVPGNDIPAPPGVSQALLRVAQDGGTRGCVQIVRLRQERARLDPAVLQAALDTLSRLVGPPAPAQSSTRVAPAWLKGLRRKNAEEEQERFSEQVRAAFDGGSGQAGLYAFLERAWSIKLLDEMGDTRARPLLEALASDPRLPALHLETLAQIPLRRELCTEMMAAIVARAPFTWAPPPGVPADPVDDLCIIHTRHADAKARLTAARWLAEAGDPRGMASLAVQAAEPTDPGLVMFQVGAAWTLASRGDQEGIRLLVLRADDPVAGPYGRATAAMALAQLNQAGYADELRRRTRADDPEEAFATAATLARVGNSEGIEALADLAAKFHAMKEYLLRSDARREDRYGSFDMITFPRGVSPYLRAAKELAALGDGRGCDTLASVASDRTVPVSTRTSAAEILLDHGDSRGAIVISAMVAEYLDPARPLNRMEEGIGTVITTHSDLAGAVDALKRTGDPDAERMSAQLDEWKDRRETEHRNAFEERLRELRQGREPKRR